MLMVGGLIGCRVTPNPNWPVISSLGSGVWQLPCIKDGSIFQPRILLLDSWPPLLSDLYQQRCNTSPCCQH